MQTKRVTSTELATLVIRCIEKTLWASFKHVDYVALSAEATNRHGSPITEHIAQEPQAMRMEGAHRHNKGAIDTKHNGGW